MAVDADSKGADVMRYKVGDKVKLSEKLLQRADDVRVQSAHVLTIQYVYPHDGVYEVEENPYWYTGWMLESVASSSGCRS